MQQKQNLIVHTERNATNAEEDSEASDKDSKIQVFLLKVFLNVFNVFNVLKTFWPERLSSVSLSKCTPIVCCTVIDERFDFFFAFIKTRGFKR